LVWSLQRRSEENAETLQNAHNLHTNSVLYITKRWPGFTDRAYFKPGLGLHVKQKRGVNIETKHILRSVSASCFQSKQISLSLVCETAADFKTF